ncbi:hypothetical protein B0O80DRAFT_240690 [Mortierella sp. GBAus27b]|nr:hypothetical protein B0O80DRAFT_240690 [Mortierella sp. GBAus27b]
MPPKEEPRSPTLVSSTLDLISEETGHDLEDSDADVIRLAQHRPYLHMQNSISGLQASSNNNNNNNSNYTTTGISLERPTGRRMVLAGVVITSRKRPRSDMSVDDDIAEPSSSSSLPESRSVPPLTKSVAVHSSTRKQKVPRRSYSERQKEILEKAYRKSKNPSAESHKQIAVDIGETVARVRTFVDPWIPQRNNWIECQESPSLTRWFHFMTHSGSAMVFDAPLQGTL